jgi:GH35 family endo-1,4-beta-xylanase
MSFKCVLSVVTTGMTPENAFKWFNYEVQPGNTSHAQALLESRYIAYAQQHRMPMLRGHTLEWLKEEEGAAAAEAATRS